MKLTVESAFSSRSLSTQRPASQTATFTDTTALLVAGQPEQKDYRCQGMLNNARVGGVSGTVSAVTVP